MSRSQEVARNTGLRTLLLIASACALLPSALAAGTGAVVSGVVLDVQGAAQMGALVQVLTGDSSTAGTAFTDAHGRYAIRNLTAGRYIVRASQSLYVPATHANVQLRTGASAVVNLTMAALFDTASWLPAARRSADEPTDDWRWTLRSSANRPILRVIADGSPVEVGAEKPAGSRSGTGTRDWVGGRFGAFGEGGTRNVLAVHHTFGGEHGDGMLWADTAASAWGLSQRLDAAFEQGVGPDGAMRTLVSYQSHPEFLQAGGAHGLQVLRVTSDRRMNLGEVLEVEVGTTMEAAHGGRSSVAAHPFLRVTAHPMGVWTLRYRMASDRQVQGFDEVAAGESDVPVALVKDGKLALESGRHQEVELARRVGRATVELAYYHDALESVAVAGVLAAHTDGSEKSAASAGWVVDRTTGALRTLANGYTTDGVRVTFSAPVTNGLHFAAEYSTGDAESAEGRTAGAGHNAAELLRPRGAQAAEVALKGKVLETGMRLHAAYRWQTASTVSAVDPFGMFGGDAFLSCGMRQSVLRNRGAGGLDATIDVTNLLAQGYRPYLSADGQTVYFTQGPRTIQAGLSFTF